MKAVETFIINSLIKEHHTELDQLKIKFGIRLILSELYKFIIVYGVALILDCVIPTLITHLSFILLRQVSFGYHLSGNLSCVLWSIVIFPVLSDILLTIQVKPQWTWFISLFSIIIVLLYAPLGTNKHRIINDQHRRYLRKKLYIRLLIIIICFMISPLIIKQFIALGLFIQCIALIIQLFIREDGLDEIVSNV